MKIQARQFQTRDDLLKYVEVTFGVDVEANHTAKHVIEGTRDELRRLFLSDKVQIYGMKCVITDTPTEFTKGQYAKPHRGKRYDFGINQRNIKAPK